MQKPPTPLTPKEKNVLEFLEIYIGDHGLAPTYQEIKNHFGFASFNSVQRYLKQLETKKYISVPGGNRKRAISLLQSSMAVQDNVEQIQNHFTAQPGRRTASELSPAKGAPSAPISEPLSLPLLGRVAAGHPIEAMEDNEFVDVPASFVRNANRSYALSVRGDSMIEDGIHNQDVILVQEQNHASQGEIIVAMVDNEATVKRFYLHRKWPAEARLSLEIEPGNWEEGPLVELRPSNAEMTSLWYLPNQVEIRGIVVGLLRKYF